MLQPGPVSQAQCPLGTPPPSPPCPAFASDLGGAEARVTVMKHAFYFPAGCGKYIRVLWNDRPLEIVM